MSAQHDVGEEEQMISELESGILQRIDEMKDEIVDFVLEMIRIPTENPPGNYGPITGYLEQRFKTFGFETTVVGKPGKPNVLARLRGTEGRPVLILNAHTDTVPAGEGWTVDPFAGVVKEGKIYGRGAYDCRARIALYAMAMKALKDANISLAGDVVLAATVDEEIGGFDGPKYLLENGYLEGDMAIVEGQDTSLRCAHKGILWLEITTYGQLEHGGREWLGINAIEKMHKVLTVLARLKSKYGRMGTTWPGEFNRFTSINIGTIKGGVKTNAVASKCTITVDCRVVPDQRTCEVKKEIEAEIQALRETDPDFRVEIETIIEEEPQVLSTDLELFRVIQQVMKERSGKELPVEAFFGLTDSRWFNKMGVPAINFGGPGGSETGVGGHKADEFVRITDLVEATKNMALIIKRVVG